MPFANTFRAVVLSVGVLGSTLSALGTPVNFSFSASLDTGTLAGTHFAGTASYDTQGSSPTGTSYLTLTSLNFTLLGELFTKNDISQGGQAILQNGVVSYFTAAFFPVNSGPVNDIAFGFGGPGVIGYSVPPGFNPGTGSYTIQTAASVTPEPSTFVLCGTALVAAFLCTPRKRTLRASLTV